MPRIFLNIEINPELRNHLQQFANEDQRTLSGFVRKVLSDYVQCHKKSDESVEKIVRKTLSSP